jgi:hypothetical protein
MGKIIEIRSHSKKKDLVIATSALSYVAFEPNGLDEAQTKITLVMAEGIPIPKVIMGKWQANKEKYLSLFSDETVQHVVFVVTQ